MTRQLVLIDESAPDWRIDQHTCEIGLRGVAQAREILARAHRRHDQDHGTTTAHLAGREAA